MRAREGAHRDRGRNGCAPHPAASKGRGKRGAIPPRDLVESKLANEPRPACNLRAAGAGGERFHLAAQQGLSEAPGGLAGVRAPWQCPVLSWRMSRRAVWGRPIFPLNSSPGIRGAGSVVPHANAGRHHVRALTLKGKGFSTDPPGRRSQAPTTASGTTRASIIRHGFFIPKTTEKVRAEGEKRPADAFRIEVRQYGCHTTPSTVFSVGSGLCAVLSR